ncbi:prenyltransferase/squalene oxidase repeat-containing protein [Paraburkholderia sp. J12]|uniref:prenyltransferase/squalene oxidase repeat-containing protein n=1 Tax=Paraburkholderia sp. J12 TaxID=2805432 RepID=UPI002ABE7482|nr:prenyltransferase/squalene oxidase repeat-containing protein [Paraburkholderia sp. J12]
MTPQPAGPLLPGLDCLWEEAARLAGLDRLAVSSAAQALLAPPLHGSPRRGGYSELNNDGHPAQLCLSQSDRGTGLRVLVDPGWFLGDASARLEASRAALAAALRDHGALDLSGPCETLLSTMLDADIAPERYPSGPLWLGVGLAQPGCAVYVDVRPLSEAVWERMERWLRCTLPDAADAVATLQRLRPGVVLSSVGIEGVSRRHARAKVYWRLKAPAPLNTLGLPLISDTRLAAFLATLLANRELPLSGLVMSAGFDLASGALEDVKIDLCGHCLPQPADAWLAVLERAARDLGVRRPDVDAALTGGRCEVAFIGAGVDRHGRHRLNLYLKPPGLASAGNTPRTLRDRMARACRYLCDLQQPDGSFRDYRLPVGEATQWVTGFVGLALAEAAQAADLPRARASAAAAADWLIRERRSAPGWGYNACTGPDADSTGFAIRLLRATGRPVDPADQDALLRHWRPGGGFATYAEGPDAWGDAHPCVSAAAFLALDSKNQNRLQSELLRFTGRMAHADGSWPSYWWRTHHYSTWHHLLLLRRLGQCGTPSPHGATGTLLETTSAFDLAYAAGIAHWRAPGSAEAARLLSDLLAAQRADGGWTGGFNLRVTDPSCCTPWVRPQGDLYRDRAGSITTGSALFVLSEILHA